MEILKNAVEKHRELILDSERWLWAHPETGYKEWESSKYISDVFESLGYKLNKAGNIPGFYTVIDTGSEGPEILILAELDSVICPTHPECNPETGAVHACGHHTQGAALIGIAAALSEPEVLNNFSGRIILCSVPAEELLEIEYRQGLKENGTIKYFGGKPEFMYRGYFDNIDIAFMVHSSSKFHVESGCVGCIVKKIKYTGKPAHAGDAPHLGKNALYAAINGLNAVNSIRETFQEKDIIRVHPIITDGGQMVNAIPATATIESYVRGASFSGIKDANIRVNQALCGAALSLDNNVDITDFPGYAPLVNNEELIDIAFEALELMIPHQELERKYVTSSGCTDMGDLSSVIPVIHPYAGGLTGKCHGDDNYTTDPAAACIDSAKWQLGMLYLLCKNNGERAFEIKKNYKAPFNSIKEYLEFMDTLECSGERITYNEDKTATVRL